MSSKGIFTQITPILALLAALCACSPSRAAEPGKTWTVSPGQSIQEALDKAAPGDIVQVLPGDYVESLEIKTNGLTLKGLEFEGERTTLKAKMNEEDEALACGVRISGNDVSIEGLIVAGFADSGVDLAGGERVAVRNLLIRDVAEFGLKAIGVRGLTLDRVVAGGARSRAFLISKSSEVSMLRCEGFSSSVGLAVVDSQQVLIDDSSFHHNGDGIVVASTTTNPEKMASYTKIFRCRVMGNQRPPKGIGDLMPPGIGLLVLGASHTEIAYSVFAHNGSMGVATMARQEGPIHHLPKDAPTLAPPAEHTYAHHNTYYGNGSAPSDEFIKQFPGVAPGDLYWDGLGVRNQWQENRELKTYPEKLVVQHGGVHTDVIHFQ